MMNRDELIAQVQLIHGKEVAELLRQDPDDEWVIRICQAALNPLFIKEKAEIQHQIRKNRHNY